MFRSISTQFVGVFLNNAAGIEVVIESISDTQKTLTFSMVGGTMDLFIFNDPDPQKVIQKYHNLIGKPVLIPDWGLGWHQCKWGYDTLDKLKTVVQNYANNGIPLDTIWNDIDYMQTYRDFTIDPVRFNGLQTWVETDLHAKQDKHYIPIVDAGVAYRPNAAVPYKFFEDGKTQDIFTKTDDGTQIFIGKVWPNDAAFPDWSNAKTSAWWQTGLDNLSFVDGIWLDMNEPSNFCGGYCYDN
jgi:alpha-glucosidase (family GH31 glycosyl hydrolase)